MTTPDRAPSGNLERGEWTPIHKTGARLARAEAEAAGSMHHFAAAQYLGEVVTKLHCLAMLGIVDQLEGGAISPPSFELARAVSTGTWISALHEAVARAQPSMLTDQNARQWL